MRPVGIRCPSTTSASLCFASSRNITPRCLRKAPIIFFFCFFGIHTIWYLQSHLVCVRLWYSFICESPLSFGQDSENHSDRRIGQTLMSPPAEPGGYLTELGCYVCVSFTGYQCCIQSHLLQMNCAALSSILTRAC